MKQKLFLSFMAIAVSVLSSSAQSEKKLVVNAGNMENISISNDMLVVLMSAAADDKSFSMNADAAELLNLKLSDNSLLISSAAGKEKTVYLYVSNLKSITVESNSQVVTLGILNTPKVEIYVDGNSTVHLRTNGIINAHGLNDTEVKIDYKTPNPLVKG